MHSQTLSEVLQAEWKEAYDAVRFLRRVDREIEQSRSEPSLVTDFEYDDDGRLIRKPFSMEYRG